MKKELTVNLANLNQTETIKARLEKQVDSLTLHHIGVWYSKEKIKKSKENINISY